MADNTTQVSEQINSAVNSALGVGALAAIYTGNFVNFGKEGGALALISKTITENGVYRAENDGADGYSIVTVNIAGIEILAGTENPSADIGEDGQLYLLTVEAEAGFSCDDEYYVDSTSTLLDSQYGTDFHKLYNGAAICVQYYTGSFRGPLLVSNVANSVLMNPPGDNRTPFSAEINGVTWYLTPTALYWGASTAYRNFPPLDDVKLDVTQDNAEAIISAILLASNGRILSAGLVVNRIFAKVDGSWVNAIGTNIEEINLGGE